MSNSYKDIVITPNKGSANDDPKIVFSGGNTSVNTDITLRVYPDANGTLSVEGSAGQLLSVTNDLSNTIFAVNDVSGLPLVEVNSTTQAVSLVPYYGKVGIGTSTPSSKLDVNGNANVNGTLAMTTAFSLRNKLINGGFDVWQRGTSFSNWSSFEYLVDRWRIGYDGTPAAGRTLTRQSFTPGQTSVPEGDPTYYLEYTFPNCGTPSNYIRSDLEGVRTLAGKTATFSFWAKVPSGTMTIGVFMAQEFGTGGTPSAGVYLAATNYTVTTTWQKFVYTVSMPSISGKTLGTNGDDRMWPAILFPTNAAGTIQLTNMQLEEGSVATPFERRPISLERTLCEYYYKRLMVLPGGGAGFGATSYYGGSSCLIYHGHFTMRASPVTSYLNNANVQYYSYAGAWTASTATITKQGTGPYNISSWFTADGDGRGKLLRKNDANDLILVLDAEL